MFISPTGSPKTLLPSCRVFPDLFIIARNSSFTYRGKSVRVTDAAREMGVQYILEGSARRAGGQVRITAQLIDARGGNSLWAQRYDRDLGDIFAVQDEVTASIVAVLPARVEAAALERASRKTTDSLEAYDYLLRGKYCHHLETPGKQRPISIGRSTSISGSPRPGPGKHAPWVKLGSKSFGRVHPNSHGRSISS
jgi:adenylate cyclase